MEGLVCARGCAGHLAQMSTLEQAFEGSTVIST